jgi:DNA primase
MALSNIQLTPQLVHAVRDAVSIEAIASEHTRLKKSGSRRLSGLCPLHKEKTPSFSVDPVQGLFYCFGCGQGGDAIKLHMLLSGDDFPAAIESLARRYGIPLPAAGPRRGGRMEERDLESVLEAAQSFFREQRKKSSFANAYLERRKIPPELIERYGVGYAPDGWRNLVGALHPKIPLADLEAAGLVARPESGGDPYDRFRNRLMFPIRSPSGRLLGFGGRTLGDDVAKYVNTAETERFHKGYLLYGLDLAKLAIRQSGKALLVEGYFDVLAAVAAGTENTVASMGTALTPDQARLLARYAEDVAVGYDADEAGENASRRALALLLGEGLAVRRPRFGTDAKGKGHDPDSLRVEQGEEALAKVIETAPDFVTLELDRLIVREAHRDPRLRAKAAQAVAELLRPIRDGILRYGYGRVAAERLGVPVDLLWRRLGVDKDALKAPVERKPDDGPRDVRSLEESLVQLLLTRPAEVPTYAELPPPEAFLDSLVRNIYATFYRLYESRSASSQGPPEAREVLGALEATGGAIDRVAQLLLEEPASLRPGELGESLQKLMRRYERQRSKELSREIAEAERAGDQDRLRSLLGEKARLNERLHPRPERPPGDVI